MSWICVGCQQVQETKTSFAPTMNHTHQIVEQLPLPEPEAPEPVASEIPAPEPEIPELTQLQKDVKAAMERDGANDDLISEMLGKLA